MKRPYARIFLLVGLLAASFASGCAGATKGNAANNLSVVATTTILADVVHSVAGDDIRITTLVPAGVDEHGYEPAPRDLAKVAEADVVFMVGAGLESFMQKIVENAGGTAALVDVSADIPLLESPFETGDHVEDESEAVGHTGDPHVWTDPNNVLIWVDSIEAALVAADPAGADGYHARAADYRQELRMLDTWIAGQVSQIPPERRKLVTDHTVFTYFAARYGFEQIGAVTPGYSSLSAPTAQQLASLEDIIRTSGTPAIFVGATANTALSDRVAADTGVRVVPILTGALTADEGPAPTYIAYMQYNVEAIISALK